MGAVIGFSKGAFKMAANLLGLAVGVVAAAILYNTFAGELAAKAGTSSEFAQVIVFLLIAILVPILLGWAATLLTRFFETIHLNTLNRLGGAVIGAIGYGLVMSFAFNLMDLQKANGDTSLNCLSNAVNSSINASMLRIRLSRICSLSPIPRKSPKVRHQCTVCATNCQAYF